MNEEDRKTLVGLEQEKAHKFLEQAKNMFVQEQWDLASNRYYYACFHAITALFIKDGLSSHSHKGLITLFGLHYVCTGKVDSYYGSFLSRMEQLRMKGDYNCLFQVTQEEIEQMQQPATQLVSLIDELLKETEV